MKFYCHPRCGTCKKAINWLDENDVSYDYINLLETTPSKETWLTILKHTNRTLKSFFNTSGKVYRENNLKYKVPEMSLEEAANWLSSDGLVIKRPFAIDEKHYTSGFKEEEYASIWKSKGE